MQAPVAAYQGSKPFVFVCYSHEDAGSVYQEISWLQDTGIMVWYDEGISPGSEWSEELASRIEDCAVFLFYASENSVHSPHCRGEINFALDQSCHMLVVHLEDAELSAGLRLSLGARQALMKYELRDEVYQRKLLSALQMFTRSAGETPRDFVPEHLARKAIESGATMIGERKQVSVMTVTVTNVGGLWDLDPEESHEILQSCRELLASSVNRFEGTIHQFSNEGVVALFGAPIAHEDHAQRACFAALHMQEAIRGWADQLRRKKGISFSARIGIDSGEIVIKSVGDDLRVELEAHGRAVGVSASVQQLAEPSRTYISSNTARHVEGYVALRSLGNFDLQGYPDGIELFELEGMGTALTRLDRARARGLTRFVGRHNEMQSLDAALQRAREGGGQVVSVVAEAGTGKSRLCSEFVDKCRRDGLVVYQAHCPVHGKSVPLLPILELLRSYFDIAVGDQPLQAREKITGRLILLDAAFEQELPLLFEFLGVPDPDLPQSELEAEARHAEPQPARTTDHVYRRPALDRRRQCRVRGAPGGRGGRHQHAAAGELSPVGIHRPLGCPLLPPADAADAPDPGQHRGTGGKSGGQ
jgi:class 3 adenylate cyclase